MAHKSTHMTVNFSATGDKASSGHFVSLGHQRFYQIRNVDSLRPFLISVVSSDDHWQFVSSTGGLTAGRVSPDTALFPYITVDKLHDSSTHTGCITVFRVKGLHEERVWEPFNQDQHDRYAFSRNLYKTLGGDALCFEEVNHDLQLAFRYTWRTSREYGFVRQCEIENLAQTPTKIDLLDGLRNILPAGTPPYIQTVSSNLVDAYKWNELDGDTGLALFTLYAGITDRAEPYESMKASTVFCLGFADRKVMISSAQLGQFRRGEPVKQENHTRGVRGAYLVNAAVELPPGKSKTWQFVADIEKTQSQVLGLRQQLSDPAEVARSIDVSIEQGSDTLTRLMAATDSLQLTAEESVSAHHYANVMFNVLRGGALVDQYDAPAEDFRQNVKDFNLAVFLRNSELLDMLPARLALPELMAIVSTSGDEQLERICRDYLPISFGRRHGDPSRPWNHFNILLRDKNNGPLLSYEGNWRDIFQNWEALLLSYPELTENVIAKFVNASTVDGYNPYCISKQGFTWTVQDQDDPWSYIGYWGDHQIIYLLKLLELSARFHPQGLSALLTRPLFSYANVPYRIKPFDQMLASPRDTIIYDHPKAERIARRIARMGLDGKLVLDAGDEVYQVNLLEKLLVPLLSKLCNLVIDGGIWMNTQRPEWNDANNALVGYGVSVVTLCYLRRYVCFMQQLLQDEGGLFEISCEVNEWLTGTAAALQGICQQLEAAPATPAFRLQALRSLGEVASRYQQVVYQDLPFSGKTQQSIDQVRQLLDDALLAIDHCIATNRRDDGLYHSYNLIESQPGGLGVSNLYLMLEGQVAALSSGAISATSAAHMLDMLFTSDLYRQDQNSFMLYPDRDLPGFLEKNRPAATDLEAIPMVADMLAANDRRIVERDPQGNYRFSAEIGNAAELQARLDDLAAEYPDDLDGAQERLLSIYEKVFNHREFTGRSGSMFGFEGLGCIYWHMISKLLLATQEIFFRAIEEGETAATCNRLGDLYYQIRAGLGFNKTPGEYGAFPTDPYSHTPRHSGARQPGMTGQVKEEVLCRFGELGMQIADGTVRFEPRLLREQEFMEKPGEFRYLDIASSWQTISPPAHSLVFTWCQVPIVYVLGGQAPGVQASSGIEVSWRDGRQQTIPGSVLPQQLSSELFRRSGGISKITVPIVRELLFNAKSA